VSTGWFTSISFANTGLRVNASVGNDLWRKK
jgi:hypothetical protein